MKQCSKCGFKKMETDFYRNRANFDMLDHYCKDCRKNRSDNYNRLHADKIAARMREYRSKLL